MSDKELKFVLSETEIPFETVLNPGMIVFKKEGNPLTNQPTDAASASEESQLF